MTEHKGKKGKQDGWIKGEGLKTICEWAKYGLTDKQIIENIGIGRTTFYSWIKKYPDFAEAIKKARIQTNIEIENAMIDLACGNKYVEEVKSVLGPKTGQIIKIEKTRRQVPPNAMLIFLAKNRMKDKYKDYAPVQAEPDNNEEKIDVQIYMPNNGRDVNDSETATRTAGAVPVH